MACTSSSLHFTRTSVKQHLYAPKGSGYVEKDEDSTLDRFRDWPDQYVPDETYEGTCVPGTARDNAPLEDLSLVACLGVKSERGRRDGVDAAARESPCHTGEHRAARVLRSALPRAAPGEPPGHAESLGAPREGGKVR